LSSLLTLAREATMITNAFFVLYRERERERERELNMNNNSH